MVAFQHLDERSGALAGSGVGILLCGTGSHDSGSPLPEIPAARNSVLSLERTLIDACGVEIANVETLIDPADPAEIASALKRAANRANRVLVFYFVGHGLVGSDKQLYLATRSASVLTPTSSFDGAMPVSEIKKILDFGSRIDTVVAILDCCYSGKAPHLGRDSRPEFEEPAAHGGYLLASAAPDEVALAPDGAPLALFTDALMTVLQKGDTQNGRSLLTLDSVFAYLRRRLPAANQPQHKTHGGSAGALILCQNRAYVPAQQSVDASEDMHDAEGGVDTECPYLGLESFRSEDERRFFGRRTLTKELLDRVASRVDRPGPLVIEGPSGAGKSSLVRAGLIPALRRGEISGSQTWEFLRFVPGAKPVGALADALSVPLREPSRSVYQQIITGTSSLTDFARRVINSDSEGDREKVLVLIVDQFEQAFAADTQHTSAFLDFLMNANGQPDRALLLLLILRSDFHSKFYDHPQLVDALNSGGEQFLVRSMTEVELREAITRPANDAGFEFENGLDDRLLRDLRSRAVGGRDTGSVLPLMSYALQQTWLHRRGKLLTHSGYEHIRGIDGAITRAAEELFASFDSSQQEACQLLILRLVAVGTDTPDTHRPLPIDQVSEIHSAAEFVAEAFIRARLLTADASALRLTHDALLDAWPRIHAWIDDERNSHLHRQLITDAAQKWNSRGRKRRAIQLDEEVAKTIHTWVKGNRAERLTNVERAFVRSVHGRKRWRLIGKRLAILAAVMLLVAIPVFASVYVLHDREEREKTFVDGLLDAAFSRLDEDPQLATLLATEAVRRSNDIDVRSRALNVVQQTSGMKAAIPTREKRREDGDGLGPSRQDDSGRVKFIESVPGHSQAVVGTADGLWLWDLNTRTTRRLSEQYSTSARVADDGRTAAVTGYGSQGGMQTAIFELQESGDQPRIVSMSMPMNSHVEDVSSNGDMAAWIDRSGRYGISRDGLEPQVLGVHSPTVDENSLNDDVVGTMTFSADRHTLAIFTSNYRGEVIYPGARSPTGYVNGILGVWDLDSGSLKAQIPFPGKFVTKVAFQPKGNLLATRTFDGLVQLWDMSTSLQVAGLPFLNINVADSVTSAYPEGPITDRAPRSPGGYMDLAFSPDGSTLGVAGSSGAHLWSIRDGAWLNEQFPGNYDSISTIGYTGDGKALVLASTRAGVIAQDLNDIAPNGIHERDLHTSGDGTVGVEVRKDGIWSWDLRATPPTPTHLSSNYVEFGYADHVPAAVNYDGTRLAFLTDNRVEVRDLSTGRALVSAIDIGHTTFGTRDVIRSLKLAISEDGDTLAVADSKGLQFWSVRQNRRSSPDVELKRPVDTMLSISGKLVTIDSAGVVVAWDFSRGESVGGWYIPGMTDVVLSDGGRTAAVSGADTSNPEIQIWDVESPDNGFGAKYRQTARSKTYLEGKKALTPDGNTLFVSSYSGVTVWDTRSGRQLGVQPLPGSAYGQPVLAGNGDLVLFPSFGVPLQVHHSIQWAVESDVIIERLCLTAGRDLTEDEWQRFLPTKPYRSTCLSK